MRHCSCCAQLAHPQPVRLIARTQRQQRKKATSVSGKGVRGELTLCHAATAALRFSCILLPQKRQRLGLMPRRLLAEVVTAWISRRRATVHPSNMCPVASDLMAWLFKDRERGMDLSLRPWMSAGDKTSATPAMIVSSAF